MRRGKATDPLPPFCRVQGLVTADAEDVEGNREGPRVEASNGVVYEVAVKEEIHRGSFGDAEGHKDWVHQHQASSSGEALGDGMALVMREKREGRVPPEHVISFLSFWGDEWDWLFSLVDFFGLYLTSFLCWASQGKRRRGCPAMIGDPDLGQEIII